MQRPVIIVVAACVIALTGLLRHPQKPDAVSQGPTEGNPATGPTNGSATASTDNLVPARTKSKIRTVHHKPTIEETTELLRGTILPLVDLPADQPLIERVARINQWIQDSGVKPHDLRVILDKSDPAANWRSEYELGVRNVPLAAVIKYLCGSTKLMAHVRENGIVELTTRDDDLIIHAQSKEPYDPTDPFSEPTVTKESKSTGENDPFGPAGETDPFADP